MNRGGGETLYQRGLGDRAREVRNHADVVRFRHRDDLHELADAAHVGQGHPGIVDQLLLDQGVDVPFVAELLAHRDRYPGAFADGLVGQDTLAADEVLAEVGMQGPPSAWRG